MKFLNYHFYLLLVISIFFGCNNNYPKSIYPIPSKKLSKQIANYKNLYGRISVLNDTTIIDQNRLSRTYSHGLLMKIGNVYKGKPVGYWFLFQDSLDLEYILKFEKGKIDSFFHPFAIINQPW